MNFIDKMVEQFMKVNRRMKRWQRVVSVLSAIVVFVTTYALVLPAITLDKETATTQAGIEVAASESEAEGDGTVYEAEPEEEPADEEAGEADDASVEEPAEDPSNEDSGSESGSEDAAPSESESDGEQGFVDEDNSSDDNTLTADEAENYATTEEAIAAVTGQTAEDVKLITEPTQLKFVDEEEEYTVFADFGEEAKLPEGVQLQVKEITKESDPEAYEMYYEKALGEMQDKYDENTALSFARFYDIAFVYEGVEIEPSGKVNVRIEYKKALEVQKDANVDTIHFDKNDEEKPEVIDSEIDAEKKRKADTKTVDAVEFESDKFSVYGIVGTETITVPFVASDGKTYEVTIAYGPEAGIPAGAELIVSELSEDGEEYQDYLEQTADAVGTAADALNYLKILDISIMNGEEKVVIQAPVDVQIKLLDKDNTEETGEKTKVVHFGESETDVIDPELNGITVNFEATGFSYYAVTTYGATSDLDGKSYAIVQANTQATEDQSIGNNTVYAGRALTTSASNQNTRLAGATVTVETHESGVNLVSSGTTQIVEWEFESAGGANTYYIKAPNGQYLTLNGTTALALSNTPQALTVTAGSGTTAGKVRISNGYRRVQSSVSAAAARTASNTQYFYNGNSNDANDVYLTLCEIEEFDPNQYPVYSGEKISVQELVDGQKYILYKNIYNEMTEQYEDWVIDGNGNPVRAYDQGDSLSLHSEISPMWVLSILTNSDGQPTGYYIFRNEETGLILHPLADGTLVKEYDPATSPTADGVSLKGREGGDYTSTIEYWDGSAMAYYGYQFTTDGEVAISSATGNNSQAFSFAEEKTSQAGLHTVATVDSAAAGVTIHMFNYPDRSTIANVTGSNSYGVGELPAQHVLATLNADGYPVFTNGRNGSTLFSPSSTYHQGTGNHLFLESVYDSTGYYEYSAFNNFAHYNNNGTFTVYQETGTPSPTSNNFYFKRGNFFPYNSLNTNNSAQNIYTGDGSLIDYENPNYGSTLYGLSGTTDYYFGMTMDFNFLMPKDGYEKGSPLVYEFNGDDDLWIYIDGVLVLDIGGVHDAFPGTINFATGEIIGGNGGAGGARTIKECFENAGVFPDGTPWDDSKVDEYFDGDTFVSYGSHQFNMFYMEHGAGASNLQTRFNLPVIEKGKVTVEKQLDNTSQVDYANVSFAYQAFAKDEHGDYQPLTSAVYEGTDTPLTFHNNVMIGENGPYNNVFYLKPREAAVFSDMIEDELYYVQEIGIKTDYYDEVLVNDVRIEGEQVNEEEGIYKSTEATARNRARVTFTNKLNEKNSNELRITKRLAEGSVDNGDTFEFRVMLENASGVLSAYYQGTYYIRDDDGVYYRYEGGNLVPNGQTPYACTAGNYGTIAQIPPDFTVVIKDLVSDTDFYVDEIRVRPNGSSSDVLIGESDWTLVSTDVTDAAEGEITDADIYDYATRKTIQGSSMGRIELEKDAQVVFTNKMASVDVQLKKVKEDGTTTISGSVFDLNKYSGSWTSIKTDIKPGEAATDTTPAVPNPVDLGELTIGRYRLTETKSPDGYIILTKHVYFEVYKDTDGDLKARLTDEAGTAVDSPTDVAAIDGPGTGDTPTYTVTITNTPGAVLPNTGGSGTLPFDVRLQDEA